MTRDPPALAWVGVLIGTLLLVGGAATAVAVFRRPGKESAGRPALPQLAGMVVVPLAVITIVLGTLALVNIRPTGRQDGTGPTGPAGPTGSESAATQVGSSGPGGPTVPDPRAGSPSAAPSPRPAAPAGLTVEVALRVGPCEYSWYYFLHATITAGGATLREAVMYNRRSDGEIFRAAAGGTPAPTMSLSKFTTGAVIWWVEVTGTDGRSGRSPDRSVSDPCRTS